MIPSDSGADIKPKQQTRKPVAWPPGFEFIGRACHSVRTAARRGLRALPALLALLQSAQARVNRVLAEQLLDAQELVVLRQTVGTAE